MKTLLVYADFDWLEEPRLVGQLTYETIRGRDSYGFAYDKEWLRDYGSLTLSDDISPYPGMQYTDEGGEIFGCFSDALPDRWGRMLFRRREEIRAREEARPVRRISSFDYLLGIDDYSRIGGLRFRESETSDFLNSFSALRVPPLTDIRTLEAASLEVEKSNMDGELPEKKWLAQLLHPGSSLGGARPKANVIDTDQTLYIAKFPSRRDDYDAGLWEHFCHTLARHAGISTAATRVIHTGSGYHTLLSRRFDRKESGQRIHFASAMTLLGLSDGDNASDGHGYLDIVDFIIRHCRDVQDNLQELFRRVAFYICIGNSDDHFRNHGFLLTKKGWTLSPAYDINPSLSEYQSLLIDANTSEASLDALVNASADYFIEEGEARRIISEVVEATKDWRSIATRLSLPKREILYFEHRLDSRLQ